MKIESKFMTAIVSKLIKTVVRKKTGYDVDVMLNGFRTTMVEDKTHVHLDVDFEVDQENLNKILKSIDL